MILRIKLETVSDDMTAASLLRINAFSPWQQNPDPAQWTDWVKRGIREQACVV